MFGFFFKKNLCDVWDNLFYVVITNFFSLILIALACVAVYFETYLNVNRVWVKPLMLGTFTLFSILACTLTFAGGENVGHKVYTHTKTYYNTCCQNLTAQFYFCRNVFHIVYDTNQHQHCAA